MPREKYALCPRCEGRGSIVNPSVDGNGITAAEMDELGEEFRADYLAGLYDITCPTCDGRRVVVDGKCFDCGGPLAAEQHAGDRCDDCASYRSLVAMELRSGA